jgi:hypothetical protein
MDSYAHNRCPQCVRQSSRTARTLSGWPKRWSLAHASLWESSHKRLKLAQLLGCVPTYVVSFSLTQNVNVWTPPAEWDGPGRHQRLASTVTRTEPQVAVRAQGAAPEPGIRRVRPEFSRWPSNVNGNRD